MLQIRFPDKSVCNEIRQAIGHRNFYMLFFESFRDAQFLCSEMTKQGHRIGFVELPSDESDLEDLHPLMHLVEAPKKLKKSLSLFLTVRFWIFALTIYTTVVLFRLLRRTLKSHFTRPITIRIWTRVRCLDFSHRSLVFKR